MQTDNTGREDLDLQDIEFRPGIYDLTPSIQNYIQNNSPIPDETLNVLNTFDQRYSFERDIIRRGRETLLYELNGIRERYDIDEIVKAVNLGVEDAQTINPETRIKPFPKFLLYMPISKGATALFGQGCAINLFRAFEEGEGKPCKRVREMTAHESTHIFLGQLGVRPPTIEKSYKHWIYDFLWEEGLAKYMENPDTQYHKEIVQDAPFWISAIKQWFANTDENQKQELLNSFLTKKYINFSTKDLEDILENNSLEEAFRLGITRATGVGYHVGSYIWEKQTGKAKQEGKTLKDLVMAGSGQMEEWMKEFN